MRKVRFLSFFSSILMFACLFIAAEWHPKAFKEQIGQSQKGNNQKFMNGPFRLVKRQSAIEHRTRAGMTIGLDLAGLSDQIEKNALVDLEHPIPHQWIVFSGLTLIILLLSVYLIGLQRLLKKRKLIDETFSRNLIRNKEAECTRVSRELHDSVGQKLMLLVKHIKSFGNEEMEAIALETLEELRGISRGLHPSVLERLGVSSAIESLVNEIDGKTDIFFTKDIQNIDCVLNKETSLHLYRIIQEVLSNVVKHSNAKAVSLTILHIGNTVEILIRDNGIGFNFSEKLRDATGLGMKTLLERSKIIQSKFHVESAAFNGTTVSLLIPTNDSF